MNGLDQLPNFVRECRECNFLAIRFAPRQRFGEMDCLLRFYLCWHGRLEWINRRFDQGGTRRVQKLVYNSTAIGGIIVIGANKGDPPNFLLRKQTAF